MFLRGYRHKVVLTGTAEISAICACTPHGSAQLLAGFNQGGRKDGRGNEPLPLRNVRCAEPPEDS